MHFLFSLQLPVTYIFPFFFATDSNCFKIKRKVGKKNNGRVTA